MTDQISNSVALPKLTGLYDRDDGSFLYPSPSKTAAHCLWFWDSVEVPDAIAKQFALAFIARVNREQASPEYNSASLKHEQWRSANRPFDRKQDYYAWADFLKEAGLIWRGDFLPEYHVVPLVRAAQMYFHAPSERFPEARESVMNTSIEMLAETLTVREIESKFELKELHSALENMPEPADLSLVVDAIASMKADLVVELINVGSSVDSSSSDARMREIEQTHSQARRDREAKSENRRQRIEEGYEDPQEPLVPATGGIRTTGGRTPAGRTTWTGKKRK